MAVKIFTDTNIIIDLIQQRPFELAILHQLVALAESGEIEIYISESVVTNALYVTRLEKHIEILLGFSKTSLLYQIPTRRTRNSPPAFANLRLAFANPVLALLRAL